MKYYRGTRVSFAVKGIQMRGQIIENSDGEIRIKGINGKLYSTDQRGRHTHFDRGTLQEESFGVRIFDTILDEKYNDTTSRQAADFWREFCFASEWDFAYERVHSIADIDYFFGSRVIPEPIIIFCGHGLDKTDQKSGFEKGWILSNGETLDGGINNQNGIRILPANKNKIIIFSACLIGKNTKMATNLKKLFNAEALFAYRTEIQDRICFLVEPFLLTLISEDARISAIPHHYETTKKSLAPLKNINQSHEKTFPLIHY
ncbi:hypothetical protein OR1_02617 [Geobacter sp. OR-1]|uniref:hypothetical protein n=1 Tax=Geobacter sp. OR-1 TaxID=1266765 RepID=UPI000542837B|nr:hypothetical protein [Geobacter sp. OR-1]GAM10328.1 hypothetical protein OR1_02617 [Geobacter sp. OR-1]